MQGESDETESFFVYGRKQINLYSKWDLNQYNYLTDGT